MENVWNIFKVNNKNIRTATITSKLWTYFTPFSSVSVVDFEQVNVSWEIWRGAPKLVEKVIFFWRIIILEICLGGRLDIYFSRIFCTYLCFGPSLGSVIFVFQFQISTHVKCLGNVMWHTFFSAFQSWRYSYFLFVSLTIFVSLKVFLEISQNSQENTFAKFLRTPFHRTRLGDWFLK